MQTILLTDLTPEKYVESEFHKKVGSPQGCLNPACGYPGRLHRHGFYERFLSGLQALLRVIRFLCPSCRKTLSRLPSFALPHRYVRVSTVERFMGGEPADAEVQRQETILKRYRGDFSEHFPWLVRGIGMLLGNRIWKAKESAPFWKALTKHYRGLACASHGLVTGFGLGLFRNYREHFWARSSRSGVGFKKKRVESDTS